MFKNFSETDKKLFFSKNDPRDPRLGDYVKPFKNLGDSKEAVAILGYPDDEGIKNNNGRAGAALAPDKIREFFYKMTPHLLKANNPEIIDIGNLNTDVDLHLRQENARETLKETFKSVSKVITLGGGNDYSYPDGSAFLESFRTTNVKPLVINFDAHLDVRPPPKNSENQFITSGTPFYRLLSDYKDFDFLEVGIQSQCNSRDHLKWVLDQGAHVLTFDEMMYSGERACIKILEFLEPFLLKKRACYVSIDIDGFSSIFAPGCSQSFATGFDVENFLIVFKVLCERLNVNLLGIYEVSPPLDTDDRTSKLAAQIMFNYLSTVSKPKHC